MLRGRKKRREGGNYISVLEKDGRKERMERGKEGQAEGRGGSRKEGRKEETKVRMERRKRAS
jgi:hypothetical protein